MATRLFKNRRELLLSLNKSLNEFELNLLGMYNSRINGIIKDPIFMSVAIDDHIVHRGHAVFDTVSVIEGKSYNLKRHLNRISKSADMARINLPFPIESIQEILLDLAASTKEKNLFMRYWLSAGPGQMAVFPAKNSSTFYAVAYASLASEKFSVKNENFVTVPTKPKLLANIKSNNYLLNALTSMESRDRNGEFGIQINTDGTIAEGSINNVAFILNKVFVTPPFDLILTGTTIERVFSFCNELVKEGLISAVQQRPVTVAETKTASEAFIIGGDAISAIVNLQGEPVGNGLEGPVSKRLKQFLIEDFSNKELTIDIPYHKYE